MSKAKRALQNYDHMQGREGKLSRMVVMDKASPYSMFIDLEDPTRETDEQPQIGLEWSTDYGWAIRVWHDNNELSLECFIKDGKLTIGTIKPQSG